ncbi:MFS transporter [Leekyejoonella antrihumi]|uniref:MFS transporter n=1 Tax=Leekyejoonella antrihumi TaxID=1660198 RepID=A0A563DWY3_9MICO|nr:MFS transporter [Leekyejoonella antrihumi]
MYLLAPVVGWMCDRVGRRALLAASCPVLLVALGLAGGAAPGASTRLAVGLVLLGLGWSMCTIAASTLLTESAPPAHESRSRVSPISRWDSPPPARAPCPE